MKVGRFLRALGALGAGTFLGACQFDKPVDVGWRVGGSVAGTWDGARVTLDLVFGSETSAVTVTGDGPFTFPADLSDGAAYEVRVREAPGHTCTVAGAVGTVTGRDIANVEVLCTGPAVTLEMSVPARGVFDAAKIRQSFQTTVLASRIAFRAVHPLLTDVRLGTQSTAPSEWTAAVPVAIGLQSLAIEMHAGELSRTYQVELERGTVAPAQALYAKSSNGLAGDLFGTSVAISGDEVLASAPGFDDGRVDAGAFYVFTRSPSGWGEREVVRASDLLAGDGLCCIAVSGDRMVVGAPGRAAGRGAAYVFRRSAAGWQQEQILSAGAGDANDRFGAAVAIDDGRIVVGAPGEDSAARMVDGDTSNNAASDAGAAYVFTLEGATWARTAYLKAQNADPGDRFGSAVGVRGAEIVVGASGEASASVSGAEQALDNSRPGAGAAYVFQAGPWRQTAYVKGDDQARGFGSSLAVGDQLLAVGAPNSIVANTSPGRAYFFERAGQAWSTARVIAGTDTDDEDAFGSSVAVDGDLVVVGAAGEGGTVAGVDPPSRNDTESFVGAVYVFHAAAGVAVQDHYLKAAVLDADDRFGESVGVSGGRVCVGAPGEASASHGVPGNPQDDTALQSGALYCFE